MTATKTVTNLVVQLTASYSTALLSSFAQKQLVLGFVAIGAGFRFGEHEGWQEQSDD